MAAQISPLRVVKSAGFHECRENGECRRRAWRLQAGWSRRQAGGGGELAHAVAFFGALGGVPGAEFRRWPRREVAWISVSGRYFGGSGVVGLAHFTELRIQSRNAASQSFMDWSLWRVWWSRNLASSSPD